MARLVTIEDIDASQSVDGVAPYDPLMRAFYAIELRGDAAFAMRRRGL